ncbi:FtsX-like permease family protein [Kocuria sp.]|uniref:FtsX-like permease family protein n=1 Tax=Kocuria sp. TaxID=1871328 RepID=UPI0026E09CE9|nr:FtsX-like permease family protein [Kocuria sp.]MDO5619009.1 hypothetical protein [Kocuria sp.]
MTACGCTHASIQAHRAPVVAPAVLGLLLRTSVRDYRSWLLPVAAYALVSGLLLSVVAGVRMYWSFDYADNSSAMVYRALSTVALCILALPLINLASAAARMSTRRKDTRLAGLRLLGASRWMLRLVVIGSALVQAVGGVLLGGLLYAALIPALGLLSVDGHRVGAAAMVLPVSLTVGMWLGLLCLAVTSSALGLRRVSIHPLAVRTRRDVPTMHWLRAALAVALLVAVTMLWRNLLNAPEIFVALSLSTVVFGLPMVAMNWAGPWIVAKAAERMHRRARTPHHLVAARMILADPRDTWRQLQSVVLLGFVAVTVGGGLALIATVQNNPTTATLVADMRSGAVLTLLYGFLTVACAVVINQSAAIIDRKGLWYTLDVLGMPVGSMDRARRLSLIYPLGVLMSAAVGAAVVIQAPVLGVGIVLSPLSILGTAVIVLVGMGLVMVAAAVGRKTLTTTLRTLPRPTL